MSAQQTTSAGQLPVVLGRRHEVLGILSVAATVLMVLSLWSYDAQGGENLVGPFGTWLASVLATAFGVAAWLLPVESALAAVRLFTGRSALLGVATLASTLVIVLVGCALTHLSLGEAVVFGGHLPGGVLGEVLGEVLRSLLGLAGAYVVGVATLLITLVLRTPVSVVTTTVRVWKWLRGWVLRFVDALRAIAEAWREAKAIERAEREAREAELAPRIVTGSLETDALAPHEDPLEDDEDPETTEGELDEDEPTLDDEAGDEADGDDDLDADADAALDEPDDVLEAEDSAPPVLAVVPKIANTNAEPEEPSKTRRTKAPRVAPSEPPLPAPKPEARLEPKPEARPAPAKLEPRAEGPTIVPPKLEPKKRIVAPATSAGRFKLPPTTLLTPNEQREERVDEETLRSNAKRLVEKLDDYGVKGRVDEIHPGPVVTMYEFEPASGTKLSRIAGLSDDLAMALAAQKVRIVAPIPGKSRVGFELPNKKRKTVFMREILEDEGWHKHKAALPVALGQDIGGQPVYYDLAKMPHLLVAGATGAGKSVGLNVMLTSLLFQKSPEEVRMLMIDPKVVELAVFDGIPHMLLPVVTDMKKAALALKWAVDEMERRYQLFANVGAKNIITFNERVEKVHAGDMTMAQFMPSRAGKVKAQGPEGEDVYLDPDLDERPDALDTLPQKLPYVVVVVDEFADLMMVAAKDVEACVARLAQKARAAGIHVILATQRPSVDVITGMIKANFPARMAFKVSQREDSRTILGSQGAEHLLGMGDMLLIPPGSSDPRRIHSAFVSEDEVQAVCDFLRSQGKPVYDENILKPRDDEGQEGSGEGGEEGEDPLYDRAVACVAQAGYCSISHIQRQLGVGYNKAAKLVEQMERQGIVGPASSKAGGRREVLVQAL